jgi:hypothetical protein
MVPMHLQKRRLFVKLIVTLLHHEYSDGKLSKFVGKKRPDRNRTGDLILVVGFPYHQTNYTLVMYWLFKYMVR